MKPAARRFTGRQMMMILLATVLATVLATALVPWSAGAAQKKAKQVVSIAGKGGARALVDTGGALKVGDGSGAMTVDGSVSIAGPVAVSGPVVVSGSVRTTPAGTPFQVTGSGSAPLVVGHGRVALTDLVMSQTNSATSRLNVTMPLYAGNDDCSSISGAVLGRLVQYSFLPAETILPINFTTPVVVDAPTVCLVPSIGSNPGLFFNYTVNGYSG